MEFERYRKALPVLCSEPYLVHFFRTTLQEKRGDDVTPRIRTMRFSKTRDKTGLRWQNSTPRTFHEQRSLADRLYREQGDVDTRHLLRHKRSTRPIPITMTVVKIS
ncbi:MAG: hypothetical protein ACSLEN_09360 [Candidatus Malihini olakiniferum]